MKKQKYTSGPHAYRRPFRIRTKVTTLATVATTAMAIDGKAEKMTTLHDAAIGFEAD